MASQPHQQPLPLGSPFCADPNWHKELRELHEAITKHQPIPIKESA